ncbi:Bone morphogenetic protein receptor type-2 [Branchiostoma belcheri]|nr:Bone morphogenetic protein receptor type-2 [Branchiostoma belcheri]
MGDLATHKAISSVTATYCAYYDPDQRAHDYTYEDDVDDYGEPIPQDEVLADNKTMKCSQDKDICFALWEAPMGETRSRFSNKEHACGEPECFTRGPSPPSMNKTKFCCCKGNMCNGNVTDLYVAPVTSAPPYPTPAYAHHSTYKEETTIIVMTVVCSTAIIISAVYFLIRVWHGSQSEVHHTMHLTDDISITPSLDMDNLKLLQVLDRGRYGCVWKGSLNEKEVAVKVFNPCHKQNFLNERDIYTTPHMEHENVIRFIGAEERIGMEGTVEYLLVMDYAHHGSLYHYLKTYIKCAEERIGMEGTVEYLLVMDYAHHGSLYHYLKTYMVNWTGMCRLGHSLARGLAHLHSDFVKGGESKPAVAHRDLTSRNILVKADGSCALSDLGFAMRLTGNRICNPGQEDTAHITEHNTTGSVTLDRRIQLTSLRLTGNRICNPGQEDTAHITEHNTTGSVTLDRRTQHTSLRLTGNRICNPGQEDTAHITEVGTVRYMAPEVLEGAVNLRDFESALKQVDMYAVGLILWEIATRCQDLYMGQPVPDYMQPFQAELGQHPTDIINTCAPLHSTFKPRQPVPDYMQPFQAELGQHPTFEELQVIVSREKRRPLLSDAWRENSQAVKSLKETIEDCWDQDAEARLTALCVEERMAELMSMWSRNSTVSPTLNRTSTGGSSAPQFRWSSLYNENSSTEPLHRMGYLLDTSDGSTSRTEMMDVKDTNVHVNTYRGRQETSASSCSDPPFMSSSRYQRIASPSTVSTSLSTNPSLLLEMESTNSLTPSTTTTTLSEHTNTAPEDLLEMETTATHPLYHYYNTMESTNSLTPSTTTTTLSEHTNTTTENLLGNYPDLISGTANTTTLIEMSETLEKHTTDPKAPNTQPCRKNLNELPKKRSMDKYERNERARHSRNYNVNIHTSDESLSGSVDHMTCKAPPNMSVDRLTHEEDLLVKHMLAEAEMNTQHLHPNKQGPLAKHENVPQRPTTLSINTVTARPETLVKAPVESNHARGRAAPAVSQSSHSSHDTASNGRCKKAQAEQIEMGIAKLESNGHQPSKIKMSPPRTHNRDRPPKPAHRVDTESSTSRESRSSVAPNQTVPTDSNTQPKSQAPPHSAETTAKSKPTKGGAMQRANSLVLPDETDAGKCPTSRRPQRPTSLDLSCFQQGQKEQPPPRAVSEMSGMDQVALEEGREREGGKDPSAKIKKRPKTPYSLPKKGLMSFSVFTPPKEKRANKSACKVNYVSGKTIVSVLNENKKTGNGTSTGEQRLSNGTTLPAKRELYTRNGETYGSQENDRMFNGLSGRGHQLEILDNGSRMVDNETQQAFVVSCV